MSDLEATSGLRPRRPEPAGGLRSWLIRIGAGLATLVLIALAGYALMPTSLWWQHAGFDSDPGLFVRKEAIEYRTCAPWSGWSQREAHAADGWSWTSRTISVAPPATTSDAGILLPKDAAIGAVYCGSTTVAGVTTECSLEGCDFPATMTLDDDLYTKGRALTFALASQAADGRRGQVFHLWVKWRPR